MVSQSLSLVLLSVILAAHQVRATSCNATTPCPASAPCCSEFGFCGSDDFCLGGCNPMASRAIDSCRPSPVCKDATYTFPNNNRVLSNATFWDGNATEYDWVVNNGHIQNTNTSGGALVLTLNESNGGTRISSTRYLHYGTVTATLKTGRWPGVVTAFITMSDIKDEIDWEFPGAATTEGQTNMFWQGVLNEKSISETAKGLTDTSTNYHDYTIDWQPKSLTFLIDGKVISTLNQADFNKGGISRFPNTPSRIQFSLWPAGIASSPPGTVAWAGGMIDYTHPDYKAAGQFYMHLQKVAIKCGGPAPTNANVTSYIYGTNATANTPTISFSNASTLLNGAISPAVFAARGAVLSVVVSVMFAVVGTVL